MTITIAEAIQLYINGIQQSRSEKTAQTYHYALASFSEALRKHDLPPDETPINLLTEDAASWLAAALKNYTPATEQLYLAATTGFYDYLAAERLTDVNLQRLRLLLRHRTRHQGQRLPQFPAEAIERVLAFVNNFTTLIEDDPHVQLRALRDRAFLITLADTGLRVHEACKLHRGDIDWNEGHALLIGKGDKQAVIRFSSRAMKTLKDYLAARAVLDGASGRPLPSLPLFARHDRGAGNKIKPITTVTGRNIVEERVRQALGDEFDGHITPHSFRHYFVTTVLRASGNLKLAQELARHSNIAVTQRYAHISNDELDKGYFEIFDEGK